MSKTQRLKLARTARRALIRYINSYNRETSAYIISELHQDIDTYRARQLRSAQTAIENLQNAEGT